MDLNARSVIDKVRAEGRRFVTEPEAKEVLRAFGVPVTKERLCRSAEEAVEAARSIGYPVVMKLVSKQIVHKTEIGAVRIGVRGEDEVMAAVRDLEGSAAKTSATIEGILVSETARGQEVIVGSLRDPQFGQMLMLGMGGILVEVYRDVSYRIVPVEDRDVMEMISELKGARLLQGYRGREKADLPSLVRMVVSVSRMLDDLDCIAEMDLNPVFVSAEGVTVADARMILS